MKELLRRNKL